MSIFKSVATVTVFSVLTRTLAFIFKVYLSRAVGAEILGLYQICLSVFFLFASLSAGGLATVLSRKTAEARALNPKERGLPLFTATLCVGLGVAAVTLALLFALEPLLSNLIPDGRALPLLKIMLPALLSTTVYSIIRGWFWGHKQFTAFSVTELLEEILRILFTLLFVSGVVSGINGAHGIALAFTVSDFLVAAILVAMFLLKGGRVAKFKGASEILKPALPLTIMRVFGSLVGTVLSVMLPARLIAAGVGVSEATASVGRIAGMANPLLFAPNAIISSLAIVLIPEMSADNANKNYASLNRHINQGVSFALLVSCAFLVIYAALGVELTELIYADTVSGEYLTYCAWLLLLMPINQIVTSSMNGIGMEKESFFTFLAGTVFMIISFWFLPRYIGIYAVIVANLICLTITVCGNLFLLRKRTNLNFGFLKTLIMVAIFAFPSILFTQTIYELTHPATGIFALILAMGAGAIMYFLLAYGFGLVDVKAFIKFRRGGKALPVQPLPPVPVVAKTATSSKRS